MEVKLNTDPNNKKQKYDKTLIIIPLLLVAIASVFFLVYPEKSASVLNNVSNYFVSKTGWLFMAFPPIMLVISMYWAFSKRGNIRMGGENAKAPVSMWTYIIILFSAGMGAGSVVFSMVEWAYYYSAPPFGMEAFSLAAAEMSTAYNMFHWGISIATLNMLLAIPFCYCYYIRKHNTLRLGDMCGIMIGEEKRYSKVLVRVINLLFIIAVLGSLSTTLGLGIPHISRSLSIVFGFPESSLINLAVILFIAVVFSFSSYLGISKGLQKLSEINVYWGFLFLAIILFGGSTIFILDNTVNAFGLMLQNYIRMSFNLDPVFGGGFAQNWTIFFICYAWGFVAMTSVVIVKLSYGRTFREMILGNIFGVAAGLFVLMGINGSNALSLQLEGKFDVAGTLASEGIQSAIVGILGQTVMGTVVGVIAFAIMLVLFIATTMDGASLTLASATIDKIDVQEEPSPVMRLVWCVILSVIPLTLTAVGAGLGTLQSLVNLIGWPIMIIGIFMLIKTGKWAKEDGY
ncbi:BCCT family transporter [Dehalobacterium formicoaceticum]|uniref:BCCT family transporter n=1 Tax=Dehalobacterium formicoaceticum TaxID=51515 RepID=UPI0031F64FCD